MGKKIAKRIKRNYQNKWKDSSRMVRKENGKKRKQRRKVLTMRNETGKIKMAEYGTEERKERNQRSGNT